MANVIHTLVGEDFADWVDARTKERHAKMTQQKDTIQLDPEIAQIFNQSTSTSVTKGMSNNLMKMGSVRRRTKEEIRVEKLQEEQKRGEVETKLR